MFFIINMNTEDKKISSNRAKKVEIVSGLTEKFGRAKAIVFTNYQGITHKQLEGFKRAIKPLQAEYVIAKNSLLTLALEENKIKLSEDKALDGQTGTLFLYDDVITPLKALAKTIKELNLPGVKFGIMESNFITGEQVLKLSSLPTREVLLTQLVGGLKSPIFGLHRALSWNLQKLVMTLNTIVGIKPTLAVATAPVAAPIVAVPTKPEPISEPEPESILAETVEEKIAEVPDQSKAQSLEKTPTAESEIQPQEVNNDEVKNEPSQEDNKGGEN